MGEVIEFHDGGGRWEVLELDLGEHFVDAAGGQAQCARVLARDPKGRETWRAGFSFAELARLLGYGSTRTARELWERLTAADPWLRQFAISLAAARGRESLPLAAKGFTKVAAHNAAVELYLYGPGLVLYFTKCGAKNARPFQQWIAERGDELMVYGATTAAGLTAARPLDALIAQTDAIRGALEELQRHDGTLRRHGGALNALKEVAELHEGRLNGLDERLTVNESFVRAMRAAKRRSIPGRVTEALRVEFAKYGCSVCRSRRGPMIRAHIKSHRDGGAADGYNLFPSCEVCNENRSAKDREYRRSKSDSYTHDPRTPEFARKLKNIQDGADPDQVRMFGT